MQSFYLKTKLFTPNLGTKLVKRERLLEKLDNGIRNHHPLMLINAPAGYGKTTLARSWIETLSSPVAWYSLDHDDSNPWQFRKYLLNAISLAMPEIADHLQSVSHTTPQPTAEFMIKLLVNEISESQQPLIIVLDDYHLIESPETNLHLNLLIDNLPEKVSLLLLTRAVPSLPLQSLETKNLLTEITAEDLRFSIEETEDFFRLNSRLSPSPEILEHLEKKTEGWAAGIQLTAAGFLEESVLKRFVTNPNEGHPLILDYLTNEVLSGQSREVLDFLFATSISDQFCTAFAAHLLDLPLKSAQNILDKLEQKNLFIFTAGHEGTWYRYHHLFLDLLRKHYKTSFKKKLPDLHRKAGEWFESNGMIDLAVRHSLDARDYAHAFSLIEENAQSMILAGSYSEYLHLVNRLPSSLKTQSPTILVYQAVSMLFNEYPHRTIIKVLDQIHQKDSSAEWEGAVEALRGIIQNKVAEPEIGIELSEKALTKIPARQIFFKNLVERNLGIAYAQVCDIQNAIIWFERLLVSSEKLNDWGGILAAYHFLGCFRKIQGQLAAAEELDNQALRFIDEKGLELIPHSIRIIAGHGQLLLQWNRIDKAKAALKRAIKIARKTNSLYAISAFQNLSEALRRENDIRGALMTIQELRSQFQSDRDNYHSIQFQSTLALEALIQLEAGRLDLAQSWLVSCGFDLYSTEELFQKYRLEFGNILPLAAKIYCANNNPEAAIRLLEAAMPVFSSQGMNAFMIRAKSAAAVAYHQSAAQEKAIKALSEALTLAAPEENLGDFMIAGADLTPLLCEVTSPDHSPDFARRLLLVLSDVERARKSSSNHLCLGDPLSRRELEVLQLFAQGLTNREIAGRLFLSINTIKSHSIKIYRKMNVKSRSQAISKARLLGILPNLSNSGFLTEEPTTA